MVRRLPKADTKQQNEIAARILKEIRERLRFLNDVGLDYLTLRARPARCPAAKASASASPRRSARA
jgi:excinuclease UvrABC ATPase subunit